MAERGCNFCSSDATTQRANLALCQRCAKVWDTATTAEEDRAAAEARAVAETNQAASEEQATLFEAVRYLVANTLPEVLSDHEFRTLLLEDLDEVISSGTE